MKRTSLMTAFLVPVAAVSLSGCGVNSIPTAEEGAKAKWADVQAAYQRRASLIPNLVGTVKGAAASEERILTRVTEARANATRITVTGDQLTDPQALANFAQAQNQLTLSLQRLQEAYPQLQSQANFATLMSQLESTENRINITIRDYNSAVQNYNTTIRTFPAVIGAKVIYGAKPMATFQATTPGADQAPDVNFDTNTGA
ncbi:MAG TPA: LemA family protein [Allosphingosinicella sp.]|jgi:LemA protein